MGSNTVLYIKVQNRSKYVGRWQQNRKRELYSYPHKIVVKIQFLTFILGIPHIHKVYAMSEVEEKV
jgi:hypothetical protein